MSNSSTGDAEWTPCRVVAPALSEGNTAAQKESKRKLFPPHRNFTMTVFGAIFN